MSRKPYNSEEPAGANRIRYWRKKRQMTLEQVADAIGTTAQTLARWETGRPVTDHQIQLIARVLDVDPSDLIASPSPMTAEERAWLDRIRGWDDATRATVEAVAEAQERFRRDKPR